MKKILLAMFGLLAILSGCGNSSDESTNGTFTETDDLGREVTYSTDRIYVDSYIGKLMYLDANLIGAYLTYQSETWPEDKVEKLTNTGDDEQLLTYVGDVAIIIDDDEDNDFTNSEIYNEIPAVQNDNVYYMDTSYAWYDDPYAVMEQLDFFEELFSGEL